MRFRNAGSSSASSTVSVPRLRSGAGAPFTLAAAARSTAGRKIRKVLPSPGDEATVTSPPLCFTMPYTVLSPSPVPLPRPLVVKNGSKI